MGVNKVCYGAVSIIDISDSTVTSDKLAKGVTAYDKAGEKIVGTMPAATQATPSITVSSGGLITASATQSAGYVPAGTKSATKQLPTQAAKTVTPGTADQTAVASGRYTTGAVTVKGDANLVAGNIKSGVSIFGVNGEYEGSGSGGSAVQSMFTLGRKNFSFDVGMTWSDFIKSDYNDGSFMRDHSSDGILYLGSYIIGFPCYGSPSYVEKTTMNEIITNIAYREIQAGGAN